MRIKHLEGETSGILIKKLKQFKTNFKKTVISVIDNGFPYSRLKFLIKEGVNCPTTLTDPRKRLFLYDQAVKHLQNGVFFEIGSYQGASAMVLAKALETKSALENRKLYCIDTWNNDAMSEGKKDTYQQFQDNIKPWQHLIISIRGKSNEVKLPFEGLCDVVFIDGDHSYEGCLADVKRFSILIREGGCLIMDDHVEFTGVTKVIGELLITGEWYIGASYNNLIALYRDQNSLHKTRRSSNKSKNLCGRAWR